MFGSLVCALSPYLFVLILGRALQGLGAALLSPAALSILTTTFREGRERNVALGIWGAASGSGGAAGVLNAKAAGVNPAARRLPCDRPG